MKNNYQFMPDLSENEYTSLENDIKENGVIIPIIKDQDGNIIDGHNRYNIAKKLKIKCKEEIKTFKSEEEKIAYAVKLNIKRRHLSSDQCKEIAKKLYTSNAEYWTQQALADLFGVSQFCIHDWLGIKGQLPRPKGRGL